MTTLGLVTPPEEGEDFQVIADDFQKYIIPGKSSILLISVSPFLNIPSNN